MGGSSKTPEVKETAQERAAAEIAMNRYNRYKTTYAPFEDKAFADMAGDESATALSRKAGGMVNADSAKAQYMAQKNQSAAIDPSRAGYRDMTQDTDRAKAIADAAGKAAGLGDDQKVAGLQAAVNVGTGQANETQISFDKMAGTALDENISRQETAFNRNAARTSAIMSGVGAVGGAAANTWGGGTTGGGVTANNTAMTHNNTANGPLWRP